MWKCLCPVYRTQILMILMIVMIIYDYFLKRIIFSDSENKDTSMLVATRKFKIQNSKFKIIAVNI